MEFLREYHSRMVEIIYQFGGTIDKFIGDGIMVTFGTPTPGPDDPERAYQCALAMRDNLADWNRIRVQVGNAPVRQAIGIHFGEAISGNIGSENRLEYTVIGDTVNLVSRIESQCKELGKELLISSAVYEKLPETHKKELQDQGSISIRGKTDPIRLYAPIS